MLDAQQVQRPPEQRQWLLCHIGAADVDRKRLATVRTVVVAELFTPGFAIVPALGYV